MSLFRRRKDPEMQRLYDREYRKAMGKQIEAKAIRDAQRRAKEGGTGKRLAKAVGRATWKYLSTPPPKSKRKKQVW